MVRERLEEWLGRLEGLPSITFAPAVQWGDITHDEAVESLNLLAGVLSDLRSGARSTMSPVASTQSSLGLKTFRAAVDLCE
jgi:hypothetical protein